MATFKSISAYQVTAITIFHSTLGALNFAYYYSHIFALTISNYTLSVNVLTGGMKAAHQFQLSHKFKYISYFKRVSPGSNCSQYNKKYLNSQQRTGALKQKLYQLINNIVLFNTLVNYTSSSIAQEHVKRFTQCTH